jgi:hypothetical protein
MFLLGELFTRIYSPAPENCGQLFNKEWNRDYKKPALIPNTEVIHKGIPTKINSFGLKNKEINFRKSKNTLRISFFGDSFTYGDGLSIQETFPSQLEKLYYLKKKDSIDIEVLNFGVSDMNTFQETMYAINYGLKFKPDIIMMVWLYNDIEMKDYTLEDFEYFVREENLGNSNDPYYANVNKENSGFKDKKGSFTLTLWKFYEYLTLKSRLIYVLGKRMKSLFQNFGLNLKKSEEIIYSDLEADGFQLSFKSLNYINDKLNKLNIEFYVVIYPPLQMLEYDYYNDLINKKVEDYCINNSIPCLNLFSSFRGLEPSILHVSSNDPHPNEYANEIASKAIEKYLREESAILNKVY